MGNGMMEGLPQMIVGYNIGTTIYDTLVVVVFLGIVSIVRYVVARRRSASF